MTESTRALTSTEAAARLGIKPATLYAYVSRGLIASRTAADGRTSLFDAEDVLRLSKRSRGRGGAPSDVTVASELTLVDATTGGIWYRGLDVLRACRELRFEEIAWWLWTGSFERMNTWRAGSQTVAAATHAQTALPQSAVPTDRLPLIASAIAAAHAHPRVRSGTSAASDVMATLVDALPGPRSGAAQFAIALATKLGGGPISRNLIKVLDASLSVTCELGLTNAALIARLTTAAGGGVASAVAAAMTSAVPDALATQRISSAVAIGAESGGAIDTLDPLTIASAFSTDTFRDGDPRARVLLDMLRDAAPDRAKVVDRICNRFAEPPTASFALAATAWACGLTAASIPALSLVAQSAGWIAHALEEQRKPTPYRPRLAYTGPPPSPALPKRPIDAVRTYLSRQ